MPPEVGRRRVLSDIDDALAHATGFREQPLELLAQGGGLGGPGMPVHFDADFQPGTANLNGIVVEMAIGKIFEVVADAYHPGMLE